MTDQIHIISLGAGVQSSTMALMAAQGEIKPMPAAAIFADTQSEPYAVYKYLIYLHGALPFPINKVTNGSLIQDILDAVQGKKSRVASIPAWTDTGGNRGKMRRQCTQEYKLKPLRDETNRLRGERDAVVWIGISTDEVSRAKDSKIKGITHRFPLLDARMSRRDCIDWMEAHGHPKPPRSACVNCPYRSNAEWRNMRDNDPVAWKRAIYMDVLGRKWPKMRSPVYLHSSLKPLHLADLSTEEDRGQLSMFNEECEGMCGV